MPEQMIASESHGAQVSPHSIGLSTADHSPAGASRATFYFLWALLFVASLLFVVEVMQRLQRGELFTLALTSEQATVFEFQDARSTGRAFFIPAIWGVFVVHISFAWIACRLSAAEDRHRFSVVVSRYRGILFLLAIATVFDGLTTIGFFHSQSVADEFHPVVRIMTYTLGLTTGPLVAKAFQFVGIVAVGAALPRVAPLLFVTATSSYGVAAFYNFWQI